MARILFCVVIFLFSGYQAVMSQPLYLDPGIAEGMLLERPIPVYSELAQRARVQGAVRLQIGVSQTGSVTQVVLLSGHPLLNDGAVNAIQQSKYSPYSLEGKAVPFWTEVEVVFLPGVSDKDYERDLKLVGPYFEQEIKCRDSINAYKLREAEEICSANLALADKLGKLRIYTKMRAYRLAGLAMIGQDKNKEALKYLKKAISLGSTYFNYDDVNLGEVLVTLGYTYSKMEELKAARDTFAKAEQTFQAAFDAGGSPLKARYLPQLKKALEYHINAAEADGAVEEVNKLKKQLASLP
jgi:TonB family protein